MFMFHKKSFLRLNFFFFTVLPIISQMKNIEMSERKLKIKNHLDRDLKDCSKNISTNC